MDDTSKHQPDGDPHQDRPDVLRISELRYRRLFESARDGILILDATTHQIIDVNPYMIELLDYPREAFLGKELWQIGLLADAEAAGAAFRSLQETGYIRYDHLPLQTRAGTRWDVEVVCNVYVEDVRLVIQCNIRDITDRIQAQAMLRDSEARFQAFMENSPVNAFMKDEGGRYVYVNHSTTQLLGTPAARPLGKTAFDYLPEEFARPLQEHDTAVLTTGEVVEVVEDIPSITGEILSWLTFKFPFTDHTGRRFVGGVAVDITARKRAEMLLIESQTRLQALFDNAQDAILLANDNGGYVDANPAACSLLGYSRTELLELNVVDVTLPHAEPTRAAWRSFMAGDERSGEITLRRKDGTMVEAEYRAAANITPGLHLSILRDITDRNQARAALQEREQTLQAILAASPDAISFIGADGRVKWSGAMLPALTAQGSAALQGRSFSEILRALLHPDDVEVVIHQCQALLAGEIEAIRVRSRVNLTQGRATVLEAHARLVRDSEGSITGMIAVTRDITEQVQLQEQLTQAKANLEQRVQERTTALRTANMALHHELSGRQQAQAAVQRSEARYRAVVAQAAEGIFLFEALSKRIVEANRAFQRMLGYTLDELLDLSLYDILTHDHATIDLHIRRVLAGEPPTPGAQAYRRKDGMLVTVEVDAMRITADEHAVVAAVVRDISERLAYERQLAHQAFHDPLTNLANRALFLNRLDHLCAHHDAPARPSALLFLDLDRFKLVNDRLGHAVGDQLLVAVAQRLQGCVRSQDTVARLGGDEFTILVDDVGDAHDAIGLAERIQVCLKPPFTLGRYEVVTSASIGIVLSGADQTSPAELMIAADNAMYRAKVTGKGSYAVFDRSIYAAMLERLQLEAELRTALARAELRLYYQPKVELATGRIAALEALLRWAHPTRGLVLPAVFIPIAEETGLIEAIGTWLLTTACRQAQTWQLEYGYDPPLTICVNLSATQFRQTTLLDDILRVLRETGLAPWQLELEITESMIMEDAGRNIVLLQALKGLGVQVAIDDFGTGYSSLSYLKRFPVDTLKIDKAFVDGLGQNPEDTAIVQTVISLAHTLGLDVTAEGIETAAQVAALQRLGCEQGQGYYFAKPLPSDTCSTLLADPRTLPRSAAAGTLAEGTGTSRVG